MQRVVLSVRGSLMLVISARGCLVSRKFVVSYFQSPGQESRECGRRSVTWQDSSAHERMVEDGVLSCFDYVGERCCVIQLYEPNSWRECNRL